MYICLYVYACVYTYMHTHTHITQYIVTVYFSVFLTRLTLLILRPHGLSIVND